MTSLHIRGQVLTHAMCVGNSTSWTYSDNICGNLDSLNASILKSPTTISTSFAYVK